MLMDYFYSDFVDGVNDSNIDSANTALMKELGNILVRNREDFVHLLNESGVSAAPSMSDAKLIDLFIANVGQNKTLALGASMLVHSHNQTLSFDGEETMSDEGIKAGYRVLNEYFADDEYSNAIDPVTAIGEAIGKGFDLGSKGLEGRQKKKYGVQDMVAKQQEAKSIMAQQAMANRQAQIDAARQKEDQGAKTTRVLLIVGGIVALGFIAYMIKNKRGK